MKPKLNRIMMFTQFFFFDELKRSFSLFWKKNEQRVEKKCISEDWYILVCTLSLLLSLSIPSFWFARFSFAPSVWWLKWVQGIQKVSVTWRFCLKAGKVKNKNFYKIVSDTNTILNSVLLWEMLCILWSIISNQFHLFTFVFESRSCQSLLIFFLSNFRGCRIFESQWRIFFCL